MKKVAPFALMVGIWLAWFGYYRLATSVVPHKAHYARNKIREEGIVKRVGGYYLFGGRYVRDGSWTEYYRSGARKAEMEYDEGELNGPRREWDESGTLIVDEVWENGVLVSSDESLTASSVPTSQQANPTATAPAAP